MSAGIILMKRYVFIAALVFFLGANLPLVRVLSISNRKNLSEKIYSLEGARGGFVISYTHSVNKGRVHDFYRVLPDDSLELFMTEFVSYGAGISEPYETGGAVFSSTNDAYVLDNLRRVIPRLVMAVGVVAKHSVSFGKESAENPRFLETNEFFLENFFAPQTSLIFEVRRISVLSYVFGRKFKKSEPHGE